MIVFHLKLTQKGGIHISAHGNHARAKTIVYEIRDWHKFNLAELGDHLGLSVGMVSHLENGRRELHHTTREVRHLLLNLAHQIPAAQQSKELKRWMKTTQREFKQRPLGARLALDARLTLDTPNKLHIEVETFAGQKDPHLTAIEELILNYDPSVVHEYDMEAQSRFEETILNALVHQANLDCEVEPDTPVLDALQRLIENLKMQGCLQTTVAELRDWNDDEGDNDGDNDNESDDEFLLLHPPGATVEEAS